MKIYTKSGDKGKTSLIGGKRISKDDIQIDAYGTIDELNSNLGLLRDYCSIDSDKSFILNSFFIKWRQSETDKIRYFVSQFYGIPSKLVCNLTDMPSIMYL